MDQGARPAVTEFDRSPAVGAGPFSIALLQVTRLLSPADSAKPGSATLSVPPGWMELATKGRWALSTEIDIGIEYLIDLEVLGRGGFSVVYAATDTRFDRRVAVKVLRPFSADSDRKAFERECRVMGRLSSHDNVVALYEAGFASDESPFMIMELVEGGSLQDLLDERGPIPWAEAVGYVRQAAQAIDHAHRSDVLHRDVKPANVLLADGVAKLTDFGISGLGVSGQTSSTHVAASWLHAPPETFPNKRDSRSDVYSLGSTLYTLIVGRPPLWRDDDDSLDTIMYRVLHEAPAPIPVDLAPATVDQLLARTLAKEPGARPQTASQLVAELGDITSGAAGDPSKPAAAGNVAGSSTSRAWPLWLAALAAVLVVLLGGGAFAATRLGEAGGSSAETEQVQAGVASGQDAAVDGGPDDADADVDADLDVDTESPVDASTPLQDDAPGEGQTTTSTASAPTTTAPTTTAPTTTASTTTTAPPPVERPVFSGAISSGSATMQPFIDFLAGHQNEIVELDIDVIIGDGDLFPSSGDGDATFVFFYSGCTDGEPQSTATCDGYQLALEEETDGTSGLYRIRGDRYRLTGFFAVGVFAGPQQGTFTQLLDPVALENLEG